MPTLVNLPSRKLQLVFPDKMSEDEIRTYVKDKYPTTGEDVAYRVEQANQQSLEGAVTVNPFEGENKMSRDDYILLKKHQAEKKSSLGDILGVATDVAGKVFSEIGNAITETGAAALVGEFQPAVQSIGEGIAAGTVGLYDIANRILRPDVNIPTKEEFLKTQVPTGELEQRQDAGTGIVGPIPRSVMRPATEEDYKALIDREMQKDADAVNRLYLMEDIIRGAPIEEIARGASYLDATAIASLGASTLAKTGVKTLFKPAVKVGVSTAPGRVGQAALTAAEKAAGAVETVASVPGQLINRVGEAVGNVFPGGAPAAKATAVTGAVMGDLGVSLAGAKTAETAAELTGTAARLSKGEAARAGLLERIALNPDTNPITRKIAYGAAQLSPVYYAAGTMLKEGLRDATVGSAVGAGLGYLAEGNLEGAAAGLGAGFAIGSTSGVLRSSFDLSREMVGLSTSRTRQQATGDINRFIAERPAIEQQMWADTVNKLADMVGVERAAAQMDALRIAEANGATVRLATANEMKKWTAPGWVNSATGKAEIVLNPKFIREQTAAHETSHVLFGSLLNRAFKTEIEQAIFGMVDPVTKSVVKPGIFDDVALANISAQIAKSYGRNKTAQSLFRGYAKTLASSTNAEKLAKARSAIADELVATYTEKLMGRLRPGTFNPDRLPLLYRKIFDGIDESVRNAFGTVLFEKGMNLRFDNTTKTLKDANGKTIRIPELDTLIKNAFSRPEVRAARAAKAKPDLIPVSMSDRAVWARSYGGAKGILNDDLTPKSVSQINDEALRRWQDKTKRLSALPDTEKIGLEFTKDKNGQTVVTARGKLSQAAIDIIVKGDALDDSAEAVLRGILDSWQTTDKSTFDTRYYGVYDRGKGSSKMVAGVKSASQNEILPYSIEANSKDGIIIRAVDMTKVRERLSTALNKPQFKDLYKNPAEALSDFKLYLDNLTKPVAMESAMLFGGGEIGAKKRNLFYDTLGFRLRNGESLVNVPESTIAKSQNTIKSYRVERFAKLQESGFAFPFEEATTYERVMKNFQPDAFTRETLPNGEAMTNPDGYRILKKTGSKLFRVYDDKGELIGTASTETAAMKKAQSDAAKTTNNALEKSSMNFAEIDAKPVKGETDVFTTTKNTFLRFQPNENVDLANYIGKTMIALPADRMGIGYAMVGPKGKEQTVPVKSQGGAGYMGLLKNAGWAFSDEKAAKSLLGRLRKVAKPGEDSVIAAITAMSPINHLKNQTGQLAYVTALQAALDSKQVSLKDLNLYISNLFESVAKSKAKLSAAARSRVQAINSFDDFKRAVTSKSLNFAEMTPILEKMQLQGTKSSLPLSVQKEIGISAFDVASQTADARYADVPFGTVVALVEIPINQTPVQSGFHYSYPWAVSGKSIGFLSEGSPVSQLTSDPRIYNKKGVLQAQPLQTVLPELDLAQQFVENRAKQEPTSTKRFNVESPDIRFQPDFFEQKGLENHELNPILGKSFNFNSNKINEEYIKQAQAAAERLGNGSAFKPSRASGDDGEAKRQMDSLRSSSLRKHEEIDARLFQDSPNGVTKEGGEHFTFIPDNKDYVIKVTKPSASGTSGFTVDEYVAKGFNQNQFRFLNFRHASVSEYVARTALFSKLFNIPWQVVEVAQTKDGSPVIYSIMKKIEGDRLNDANPVDRKAVEKLMTSKGFEYLGDNYLTFRRGSEKLEGITFFNPKTGVLISDAEPRNFVRTKAGKIEPVDLMINVFPAKYDIRYQPDAASPSILNGINGTKIIKSPSGKFRVYSATGTLLGIRDTEQSAKKLATK